MGSNYDSILKEDKVYMEEVRKKNPVVKYVVIELVVLVVILGISYIVYYQTVLAPHNIFMNDFNSLISQYSKILKPLNIDRYFKDFTMKGNLVLNDFSYQYEILKSDNNCNLQLTFEEQSINYYRTNNSTIIEVPSLKDKGIVLDNISFLDIVQNFDKIDEKLLKDITSERSIKHFFWDDKEPIVEVGLNLKTDDLIKFGFDFEEDYDVIITLRNQAITNEIVSMKVIINNKTKNIRNVLSYQDNVLTYMDNDGLVMKFNLQTKQDDITLKIYRGEELYSVLSGITKESSYQYVYQIIDEVYNIQLNMRKISGVEYYEITSNIERDGISKKQSASLNVVYTEGSSGGISSLNQVEKASLLDEEKVLYNNDIEKIVLPLKSFIDGYK